MGGVAENDWKLFRERLPRWQESYMEKLIGEYMEMLGGEGLASEKFWGAGEARKRGQGALGRVDRKDEPQHDAS